MQLRGVRRRDRGGGRRRAQPPMSQRRWAPARRHRTPAVLPHPVRRCERGRRRQVSERRPAASRQPASELPRRPGRRDGVTGAGNRRERAHQEHSGDDEDSASSDQDRKPASRAGRARGLQTWPVVERDGAVRISKKTRRHVDGWWRAALRRLRADRRRWRGHRGQRLRSRRFRSRELRDSARPAALPRASRPAGWMVRLAQQPGPGNGSAAPSSGRNPPTNSSNSPSACSRLRRYSWIDRCSRSSSSSAGRSSNGTLGLLSHDV